jgi:hypothetical protein
MFCHITQIWKTWRGKPLISRLAVIELTAATSSTAAPVTDSSHRRLR